MKVPFTTNTQPVISKPLTNCNTTTNAAAAAGTVVSSGTNSCLGYEPKSVLDLRRSPSPVADNNNKKPVVASSDIIATICDHNQDPLQLDNNNNDHVLNNNHLDEWDSLMRELGLHDDSTPVSRQSSHSDPSLSQTSVYTSLPEFPTVNSFDSTQFVSSDFSTLSELPAAYAAAPLNIFDLSADDIQNFHQVNNRGVGVGAGFDFVDELIRFAECFETNSFQLGHVILARLHQRLRSPTGKPLQRAAFYFKEALQSLLTGSTRPTRPAASTSEIVQTIKAHKNFSNVSPIPMFCSFTANQAMLEAVDGACHVHVIDFDIQLGGHWASFMKELSDSRKPGQLFLRISALVPEEYGLESKLIKENLTQFALELNIRFEIEFVSIRTFEYLSFKAIKFMEGEKIAVLLSPAIFRHVGHGFVNEIRRISPHVVVAVDGEGLTGFGGSSYRQAVIDGLEFYSTLLESLEAANVNGELMRKIETFVLFPKIQQSVEVAGRRGTPWREAFAAAGMRQVGLSQFADFQAECLLRRLQARGFHVAKRQAEMMLCWHERPLVATSAWRI